MFQWILERVACWEYLEQLLERWNSKEGHFLPCLNFVLQPPSIQVIWGCSPCLVGFPWRLFSSLILSAAFEGEKKLKIIFLYWTAVRLIENKDTCVLLASSSWEKNIWMTDCQCQHQQKKDPQTTKQNKEYNGTHLSNTSNEHAHPQYFLIWST